MLTVAQGRLLKGQNPAAVTAVQFLGAAIAALPVAALTEGLPPAPHAGGASVVAVLAVAGLAALGTLAPFTLFAFGQRQVTAEVAGAFLNLEPLVGALVGVLAFGDPAGPRLFAGGAAILGGIVMSSLPALRHTRLVTVG
jgi:drug/metabolite transporter (DMT)-like permease